MSRDLPEEMSQEMKEASTQALRDRRMGILTLQPKIMLKLFNACLMSPADIVTRPNIPEGLPDDLLFGACYFDHCRNRFDLVVYHESLPTTEPNSMLPRIGEIESWTRYQLVDGAYQPIDG